MYIMESDIPISSGPLNIVEVNYDTLFDPTETTHLSEILVSPMAQQQHAEVSRPIISEGTSLDSSTSLVEGERPVPLEFTTTEVLVLEETDPESTRRPTIHLNVSEDSDDEVAKNIDTRSDPRIIHHSSIQRGTDVTCLGGTIHGSGGNPFINLGELPLLTVVPIPTNQDSSASCSQIEGDLPSSIAESSGIEYIPSATAAYHQQS